MKGEYEGNMKGKKGKNEREKNRMVGNNVRN